MYIISYIYRSYSLFFVYVYCLPHVLAHELLFFPHILFRLIISKICIIYLVYWYLRPLLVSVLPCWCYPRWLQVSFPKSFHESWIYHIYNCHENMEMIYIASFLGVPKYLFHVSSCIPGLAVQHARPIYQVYWCFQASTCYFLRPWTKCVSSCHQAWNESIFTWTHEQGSVGLWQEAKNTLAAISIH